MCVFSVPDQLAQFSKWQTFTWSTVD